MAAYKFKYVCKKCKSIHWYEPNPDKGCSACGHKKIDKIEIPQPKKK